MDWLKNNGDRFGLLVVALIAITASGMMISKSLSFSDGFKYDPVVGEARGRTVPETAEAAVKSSQEAIREDRIWKLPALSSKSGVPLFRSVVLIQKGDQIYDMEKPDGPQLRPPVPNWFLLKHGLDYTRTDVLDQDKDGDGFSNIEEFNGIAGVSTDPSDLEDHPPLTNKLFVRDRKEESYWIVFTGSSGDLFQVGERRTGGKVNRKFVREGEKFFADGRFAVESYRREKRFNESLNTDIDTGILTVRDGSTGQTLELEEKKELDLPTYTGVFIYTWKVDQEMEVGKGKLFKIPGDTRDFKLTETLKSEALITPWNAATDMPAGDPVRIESESKRGSVAPGLPDRPMQLPPGTLPTDPGTLPTDPGTLPTDPAPVTPDPTAPVPVAPAPVTPAPVNPVPGAGTPTPITPAPITPAPITPAPITPAPITPVPGVPVPGVPAPIPPSTAPPVTPVVPAPVTPATAPSVTPATAPSVTPVVPAPVAPATAPVVPAPVAPSVPVVPSAPVAPPVAPSVVPAAPAPVVPGTAPSVAPPTAPTAPLPPHPLSP